MWTHFIKQYAAQYDDHALPRRANPRTTAIMLDVTVCVLRLVWRFAATSACVYSWSALAVLTKYMAAASACLFVLSSADGVKEQVAAWGYRGVAHNKCR